MAITYDILGVPTSTSAVNTEKFSETSANLKRVKAPTNVDGKGNLVETVYKAYTAEPGIEPTISIRSGISNGAGVSKRRTVRLNVAVTHRVTDSVTGETRDELGYCVIELGVPLGAYEVADVDRLLASTFGLFFPSVAAGVRDTTRLDWMLRGNTDVLGL